MKYASAYLRNGQVFLNPISKTTKGLLMTWDPLVISSEEDPELGKKVLGHSVYRTRLVIFADHVIGKSEWRRALKSVRPHLARSSKL